MRVCCQNSFLSNPSARSFLEGIGPAAGAPLSHPVLGRPIPERSPHPLKNSSRKRMPITRGPARQTTAHLRGVMPSSRHKGRGGPTSTDREHASRLTAEGSSEARSAGRGGDHVSSEKARACAHTGHGSGAGLRPRNPKRCLPRRERATFRRVPLVLSSYF